MQINATLLIQIVNFVVAYKILDYLLFKPVIESLNEKNSRKNQFTESIKKEEEILVSLAKEKKEKVASFQTRIKKQYPFEPHVVSEKPETLKISDEKEKKVDSEKLEKDVVKWLLEKVPHGY